jgi:hypothetical protein
VKRLDASAFSDCHSLKRLVLPSSLEKVGLNVFYGLEILYDDGTWVPITADALHGHSFSGYDGVMRMES